MYSESKHARIWRYFCLKKAAVNVKSMGRITAIKNNAYPNAPSAKSVTVCDDVTEKAVTSTASGHKILLAVALPVAR